MKTIASPGTAKVGVLTALQCGHTRLGLDGGQVKHRVGVLKGAVHIWEFYLAYCEAAFDEENIDVVQYTLQKRGV